MDIDDVLEYLRPIPYKWRIIGEELGINVDTLGEIHEKHFGQNSTCQREMIIEWIKGRTSSWGALANALQSVPVREDEIALKIREMMRGIVLIVIVRQV